MKKIVGEVALGAILVTSTILFTNCGTDEGSVTYNEHKGEVHIPGATIITLGEEYEDFAPLADTGLALVIFENEGDSLLYFYCPLQGDLDSLTFESSREAVISALLHAYGESASIQQVQEDMMLETGIRVRELGTGQLEFTNELHRWAAVECASSSRRQEIIPPTRCLKLDVISAFEGEWNDIIQFNRSYSVTIPYEENDVFNTYGSIALLGLTSSAHFALVGEDFYQAVIDGFESNPDLFVRVNVCGGIDYLFFVVRMVLGEFGVDLLLDQIATVGSNVLVSAVHTTLQQVVSDNISGETLARDVGNTLLESLIEAVIKGGTTSSFGASSNLTPGEVEEAQAASLAALFAVLKAAKIIVGVVEIETSLYDEIHHLPFDRTVHIEASNTIDPQTASSGETVTWTIELNNQSAITINVDSIYVKETIVGGPYDGEGGDSVFLAIDPTVPPNTKITVYSKSNKVYNFFPFSFTIQNTTTVYTNIGTASATTTYTILPSSIGPRERKGNLVSLTIEQAQE